MFANGTSLIGTFLEKFDVLMRCFQMDNKKRYWILIIIIIIIIILNF